MASCSFVSQHLRQMPGLLCSPLKRILARATLRSIHTTARQNAIRACRLSSRGVLRLAGRDTSSFLQGLVTNDVNELMEKAPSMQYCFMLNVQGRVLYDLFFCNASTDPADPILYVDVDLDVKEDLVKILRRYKLRKKVDISDVSDTFNVWSHFQPGMSIPDPNSPAPHTELHAELHTGESYSFQDPRVPAFAHRIYTTDSKSKLEEASPPAYRVHRYQWGIPEGTADLPPGNCLPLESNLALMNGVNFNKGCYIGQELTARTYHTGVTRKRLLPLVLTRNADIESGSTISTSAGKNAGKFRHKEGRQGLGLVRLARLKDELYVNCVHADHEKIGLTCHVPEWWPANALNPDPTS